MTNNVKHSNEMLANIKRQHQEKIEELERIIENLQTEIKLIEDFHNRLDDL